MVKYYKIDMYDRYAKNIWRYCREYLVFEPRLSIPSIIILKSLNFEFTIIIIHFSVLKLFYYGSQTPCPRQIVVKCAIFRGSSAAGLDLRWRMIINQAHSGVWRTKMRLRASLRSSAHPTAGGPRGVICHFGSDLCSSMMIIIAS